MVERPTFTPLNENWERALVVVAHPDDMEFGSAAAVARWTGQGKDIAYCLVTSGEAGIDALPPDECRAIREEEQRRSCEIVGVTKLEFLGFQDGIIEYGLPLRAAIAEAVRRHRPEIVISNSTAPSWGDNGPLNQADHIATGRATLDAVRDAGNRWIFNDQLKDGLEPWGGVRQVWMAASPQSQHAVDTTDTFDAGVDSLRAHQAYIEGLGWDNFDPQEFLESHARMVGGGLGVKFGAAFEVLRLTFGDEEE